MPASARVMVAAAVLSAAAAACAARTRAAAPVETPAGVRFVVELPAARSVALAGSFNDWSASTYPLVRASGLWSIVVALPPGEHTFMYVVNGTQWITPPDAEEYADDGFGAKNGVLIVRPKER